MKGLHPEFLLGKKGSHLETMINALCAIGPDPDEHEKFSEREKNVLRQEVKFLEQNQTINFFEGTEKALTCDKMKMKNAISVVEASKLGSFGIYSVGKNFFEAVSKLNRDVPFKYIGDDKDVLFIKTPNITMNGTVYNGCYVRCMEHGVMLMATPRDFYTLQGCRIVLSFAANGKMSIIDEPEYFEDKHLQLDPNYEETQVFADFTTTDYKAFTSWMNGVVNTAVYINSQDPEIEELKPLRLYDRKQLNAVESTKRENLCTVPVRLVHWGYHSRSYSVDSTVVTGHFRWQPCGVDRSEVKLIWIDEHTRTYDVIPDGIQEQIDVKAVV